MRGPGERADGVLVFGLLLALYLPLLPPGWRLHGDAAELALVGAVGGVAHPPGYPLWSRLAQAVTLLVPLGRLPWRVALFTALTMAGAGAALRAVLRRVGAPRVVAAALAVGFGALPGPLRWGTMPEVYGLHLLFVGTAWALALGGRPRGAGVVAGLALAHHPTAALLLPGLWLALPGARWRLLGGLAAGGTAAAALVGAMLLGDAPVAPREHAEPLALLTGAPFRGHLLAVGPGDQLATLAAQGGALSLGLMGLGLGGALALGRRGLALHGLLGAAFVLAWGVADPEPFALPLVWLGVVVAGALWAKLPQARPWTRILAHGALPGLALLLASRTAPLSQPGLARMQDAHLAAILEEVPAGAVVVTGAWAPRMGLLGASLLESDRGVVVLGRDPGPAAAAELARWVGGEGALPVVETGARVPPGRPLRVADGRLLAHLRARGLGLRPAEAGTWAVDAGRRSP